MANENWPVYGEITGPIVMIGFGSIGRGTLPLIERHFKFDKSRMTVIDPRDDDRKLLDERGIAFVQEAVTKEELQEAADAASDQGRRPGLLRQPVGRHRLGRSDEALPQARRALHRHGRRAVARLLLRRQGRQCQRAPTTRCARRCARKKRKNPGGATAVSACGANPGMVSWFVKQALVNLATDLGLEFRGAGAGRSRRLGEADEEGRRQGHPHRRARHPAHQEARSR